MNRETSRVNVNRAADGSDDKALSYPMHKVAGVLPGEDAAWTVIESLAENGFAEHEMELWGGPEALAMLKRNFEQSGLFGFVRRVALEMGEEGEMLRSYQAACENGQFLLLVPAPDESAKAAVHNAMLAGEALSVSYYDQLTVQRL